MELRAGYKQTEVGVIPEDWEVISLKNVSLDMLQGINTAIDKPEYVDSGIPILKANNVIDMEVKFDGADHISLKSYNGYGDRYKLKKNDFLFSNIGARLGTGSLLKSDVKCTFAWNIMRIIPNEKKIDPRYLSLVINSPTISGSIKDSQSGSGMGFVPKGTMEKVQIPLPPTKTEQTAIANALSDADAWIQSLTRLITKKRRIKQGAMQTLLIGKKRLSEFVKSDGHKNTEVGVIPEDWEVKPLYSLTTLMTNGFVGTAKSHYTKDADGTTYIQGYNVLENDFNFRGIKRVTKDFHLRHKKSSLREGDLLMVQTGDVGLTTYVPKELEGSNCHALIITRFKKANFDAKFFSYYLNSGQGRSRLKDIEVGTTMKHINVGDLLHFLVPTPPTKEEQTRIATILTDMDKSITQLETKLAKAKTLKQGMMQNLLTGKIRLVNPKECHDAAA